jgi:hypothetical protein
MRLLVSIKSQTKARDGCRGGRSFSWSKTTFTPPDGWESHPCRSPLADGVFHRGERFINVLARVS